MSVKWNPSKDLPDLTGKIFVVTGTSNGGVGREIVKHLGLGGAKVYCTARSEKKSKESIDGILEEHPKISKDRLVPLMVDFASPESVQDAAAELMKKETKIDVLITNAGVLQYDFATSEAGWEEQMTVNFFGHFIFINNLMPLLRKSAASGSDVRIVHVGSNAAEVLAGPYTFDFSDRQLYRGEIPPITQAHRLMSSIAYIPGSVRYAVSKLAVLMFAAELQRRFDADKLPILSVCINPGTANSHGSAPAVLKPWVRRFAKWMTVTPDEASWNALFFGTAEAARDEKYKGKYHEPVAVITKSHAQVEDLQQRAFLWEAATEEINTYFKSKGRPELGPW
ncbi:short chain dehydrogenase domain-containing protein [Sarocladium implicatum]|nr:short chain dehydrogenase domain-containing protein [Sarocladium implicatum]